MSHQGAFDRGFVRRHPGHVHIRGRVHFEGGFYTDWNGTTKTGTLIGSAKNYPYSVIYQPAGPAGATHLIKAIGYDNNGVVVPSAAVPTNPNQDEILLSMAAANPSGLPTATIITPASGSLVEIPNYLADPSATIPVIVTAGAQGGAGSRRWNST